MALGEYRFSLPTAAYQEFTHLADGAPLGGAGVPGAAAGAAVRGAGAAQDVGVPRAHRAPGVGLRFGQHRPDPDRIRGCWESGAPAIAASAASWRGFFLEKSHRTRGGTDERGELPRPAPLYAAGGCSSRTAWLRSMRGRTLTITMRWVRKRTSSITPVQVMP